MTERLPDGDPFRTSPEPIRERRPDGLDEMRAERARKNRRTALVLIPPFAFGAVVLCSHGMGAALIGFSDGVPFGARQPFMLAAYGLGVLLPVYGGWRAMSRVWTVVLLAGALVAGAAWTRAEVGDLRASREASARQWCTNELGDHASDATLAPCVARTVRCIARLESSAGDPSTVVYLGSPCDISDPRP